MFLSRAKNIRVSRLLRLFSKDRKFSDKHEKNPTFGFKDVESKDRQGLVNEVFSSVADSYDVMNDLMSFGVHRLWKEYFVNEIGLLKSKWVYKDGKIKEKVPCRVLDVAGGTGDIAFKIIDKQQQFNRNISDYLEVNILDINGEMLRVGQQRAEKFNYDMTMLNFIEGNAEDLKTIESNSIDLYTIAFGIRNVTNIPKALKEANRVLKRGGRFMCLEFSKVNNPLLRELYKNYSFSVIPLIGELVSGDKASYQYLVESIEKFHSQEDFKVMIQDAGFKHVSFENLTDGIVALHSGFKL